MLITLQEVSKSYSGIRILEKISLTVEAPKITCILGPSGAGKSTVLNILSQSEAADTGGVITGPGLKLSYVFQEDCLLPWFTVSENIGFVKENEAGAAAEIAGFLEDVGLSAYGDHYPHQLSGGMRQRCSIARAFYHGGNVLLMDEPFHSLDYHLRFDLVKKLIMLWERKLCAVVFVTHDIDEALLLGDEIVILARHPGRIVKRIGLNTPQRSRSLKDPELTMIRADILDQLLSVQ
ncbi:ABC transporter ATP-binding protein [Paenibacillus sp. MMS20-IR301]|uniref:ABC transporter ATP-binding protein n=1 Tax=Paenibacillus sp. MMS20-IR301 TaxID=2895946 RepID=UPI0028E88DAB|nr:ABC transporter ATP-binding protein [Paenibacillus sp. MMS20-IR301]WNS45570.1 ABC transporter ATP-binding protein [Paenibacillus sp. MMS20-IR301]